MPAALASACLYERCPRPAATRGYCVVHRLSVEEQGYGHAWRRRRAANLPGARCAECGATERLQRDHIVPRSLGGSDDDANLRWLCVSCHARVGLRSSSRS